MRRGIIGEVLSSVVTSTSSFFEGVGSTIVLSSSTVLKRPTDKEAIYSDFYAVGNDIKKQIITYTAWISKEKK